MNKVILIGRIGSDIEAKEFDNFTTYSFSVATNESWKDKQTGERKTVTDWHKIQVTGKRGEMMRNFFKKGDAITIEGKAKTREYENKEGQKLKYSYIQLTDFEFPISSNKLNNEPQQTKSNEQNITDDLPF